MNRPSLQNLSFLIFSVAIGILAAVGALFFRTLIEIFQGLFWHSGTTFLERLIESPWWIKLIVPTAGGLMAGILIRLWVPEARGPGVSELILSVAIRGSTIRHRVTFLKALVTSLLIGSGASVGREGPIAQIGASVGSSLAQLFKLDPDLRKVCLAAGAAAGISATFNAPITGTLFAVEIILLDIEMVYISHIIIASVIASVLSRFFWGEFPTFLAFSFELNYYWELIVYLVLGILSGFVSIIFVRMIYSADGLFRKIPVPEWVKPGIGGFLLGVIALKLPHVLGVGYDTVNLALAGTLGLQLALIVLAVKILATSLSIGSGMSGGIFAPSLFLGASLGTVVGIGANFLLGDPNLIASNYALAGMGAVVAGTTLAPITAILTIFELTYNYQIMLPLMISCISSALVMRVFFGYSAYEMKLIKAGINIVRGHDVSILRHLQVKDHMTRHIETLRESSNLSELVDRVIASPYPHFTVLNSEEKLAGVISLRDLKESLGRFRELKDIVIAADLMTRKVITISPEDNLEKALHLFEEHRISFLPVATAIMPDEVLGILKKDDLLQIYKERVLKFQMLSSP